ncbi:putative transport protein [Escherichia coli]|uniref:Putative transport protein n=1 Tax=Escherichia coli TaxID=562 RepID=A0A377ANJ6_ECOLX|nr:putative transport protein [Escherichia coli]
MGSFVADRHGIWRAGWGCAGWAFCSPSFCSSPTGIIFSGIQANAVARALSFSFDFPPLVTGIILAVFALLAITRGLHGVARLMQGFVPLMAIIWVLTSLVICVMNIGQLPHVIWSIFESAFGWQEAGRRRGGIYLKPGDY